MKITRLSIYKHRYAFLTFFLVAGISAYLLYPALFFDRSLVHADNLHHGYSFLKFHHDVIHRGLSPLWSNSIFGGHALFAEGQAGLANPLNYLVAWLLPPETGHNWLHWIAMTALGFGCFGLCRSLELSPVSALFASLASTFSSLSIHTNTNLTAIEAMLWIPWVLWAFEVWIKNPSRWRAVVFGLATAMLLLSGYPHFVHGVVIYMAVSLWSLRPENCVSRDWKSLLYQYGSTGLLAVAICASLTAFQWLPLLELAALSHRREGIDELITLSAEFLLGGLLFSNTASTEGPVPYFPIVGSLLVCVLASSSLALKPNARIKGHIAAVFLLLNLGMGDASPLYRFIETHELIPGMSNFRMMFPYFNVAVVGVALLAANALDQLMRSPSSVQQSPITAINWLLLVLCWPVILYLTTIPESPMTNFLTVVGGFASFTILTLSGLRQFFPVAATLLLLTEIMLLKVAPFGTVDNNLLRSKPVSVEYIISQKGYRDFKHYQYSEIWIALVSPYHSNLEGLAENNREQIVASNNLLWGIRSFSGALALQSFRKPLVNTLVQEEIQGITGVNAGERLMDALSIRWLSGVRSPDRRNLLPIRDKNGQLTVWENPHAHPLIQTYVQAQPVVDTSQALDEIRNNGAGTLYVEAPLNTAPAEQWNGKAGKIILHRQKTEDDHYRFHTNSQHGYWLFLSDTYHPGWKALIDDAEVPVYPAQILGKAVYIPSGEHFIELLFQPDSVRIGAWISGASGLVLVSAWLYSRIRRQINTHRRS